MGVRRWVREVLTQLYERRLARALEGADIPCHVGVIVDGNRRWARAIGLDTGAMSGFDNAKVDEAFLAGTSWKSNFLVNLGYGDESGLFPRSPRLSFDEAARLE